MAELASAGRKFAVATVVRTQGSTPQVVGAKLVVSDDENERPRGTLGGGCVEADAILACRDILAGGPHASRLFTRGRACLEHRPRLRRHDVDSCGGRRPTPSASVARLPARNSRARSTPARRFAIATLLEKQGRDLAFAGRMFVVATGRLGSIGDADRAVPLRTKRCGSCRTARLV